MGIHGIINGKSLFCFIGGTEMTNQKMFFNMLTRCACVLMCVMLCVPGSAMAKKYTNTHSLKYDVGGDGVGPAMQSCICESDKKSCSCNITLQGMLKFSDRKIFTGWDIGNPGQKVSISKDTITKANWARAHCEALNARDVRITRVQNNTVSCVAICKDGYTVDGKSNGSKRLEFTGKAGEADVSRQCKKVPVDTATTTTNAKPATTPTKQGKDCRYGTINVGDTYYYPGPNRSAVDSPLCKSVGGAAVLYCYIKCNNGTWEYGGASRCVDGYDVVDEKCVKVDASGPTTGKTYTHTVTYNINGGKGVVPDSHSCTCTSQKENEGCTCNVTVKDLVRSDSTNKIFTSWNVGEPGMSLPLNADKRILAVWQDGWCHVDNAEHIQSIVEGNRLRCVASCKDGYTVNGKSNGSRKLEIKGNYGVAEVSGQCKKISTTTTSATCSCANHVAGGACAKAAVINGKCLPIECPKTVTSGGKIYNAFMVRDSKGGAILYHCHNDSECKKQNKVLNTWTEDGVAYTDKICVDVTKPEDSTENDDQNKQNTGPVTEPGVEQVPGQDAENKKICEDSFGVWTGGSCVCDPNKNLKYASDLSCACINEDYVRNMVNKTCELSDLAKQKLLCNSISGAYWNNVTKQCACTDPDSDIDEVTKTCKENISKKQAWASKKITDSVDALKSYTGSLDVSKWKDKEGNFNTARLVSDATAGVVLGTAGALITSSLVKKSQIEQGFEDIQCVIGGQTVAGWGDEFVVGVQ